MCPTGINTTCPNVTEQNKLLQYTGILQVRHIVYNMMNVTVDKTYSKEINCEMSWAVQDQPK